jgi:UDP:flavonoid glycosyltransferase YjiC (YdhE family)
VLNLGISQLTSKMLLKYLLVPILLVCLAKSTDGYKILTYCAQFGQSHIWFMGGISDQLAEAGHNVTYLQPELVHTIKSTGATKAKVLVRKADFETDILLKQADVWGMDFSSNDVLKQFSQFGKLLALSCYHMLKDEALMNQLAAEQFDIGIGEHYDSCTYALFQRLGIKKFISAYAVPIYSAALNQIGLPITTSFIPFMSSKTGPEMTYSERATAFFTSHLYKMVTKNVLSEPINEAIHKALGYEVRAEDYAPHSSYHFVNTDEHLDYVQPITHKVIYIGGLRLSEPKPLQAEFEQIAKQSVRGMVLISFGTVALSSKMPNQTKTEFVEFISNFPDITFIWKYETPEDNYVPQMSNLVLSQWVPQSDLLAHPKMLAFITHAGMNSVSEAAHRGVPMLTIPLFGDQQRNAQMVKFREIGRVVRRSELTARTLTKELNNLIAKDSIYRPSAQHLSQMIQNKPFPTPDRVVKLTEHAIRFDVSENLDLYARKLNTMEYYGLDIYVPLAFALTFTLYSFYFISTRLLRLGLKLTGVTRKNKTD